MDQDSYNQIKAKVKSQLRKYGMTKHTEDVLHDLLLAYQEGRSQKQLVTFYVIDWLRKNIVENRNDKFALKRKAFHYAPNIKESDIHYRPTDEADVLLDIERFYDYIIEERTRYMTILYYRYGYNLKQIGRVFKVSDERASQLIKEAIEDMKIHLQYGAFSKVRDVIQGS